MKATTPIKGRITRDSIKALTYSLIQEYIREKGWRYLNEFTLNLKDLYEIILYPHFEYKVVTSVDLGFYEDMKVLGKTITKEKVILIDPSISPPNVDPRYPFTFGHEFGHGVLHVDASESFRCTQESIFGRRHTNIRETQANTFSANLFMPDNLVVAQFRCCYEQAHPFRYIGRRRYWVKRFGASIPIDVTSFSHFCIQIAAPLCFRFGNISKTSMAIKLQGLGLIENHTNEEFDNEATKIGDVLRVALKKL